MRRGRRRTAPPRATRARSTSCPGRATVVTLGEPPRGSVGTDRSLCGSGVPVTLVTIRNLDSVCQGGILELVTTAASSLIPVVQKPLRADARRNRERIMAAARAVFADKG